MSLTTPTPLRLIARGRQRPSITFMKSPDLDGGIFSG
jgi:hypothetical protein